MINLKGLKNGLGVAITTRRERKKFGYADTDLYNFDRYLAELLVDALPRILGFESTDKTKIDFIVQQMDKYAKSSYTTGYDDADRAEFQRAIKYLGEVWTGLWF